MSEQNTNPKRPLQARRRRATYRFAFRVVMLLLLIGGVAYAAWFAPWTRPLSRVPLEAKP